VKNNAHFAFALLAILGSACAGTVTLTGSCPNRVLNGTAFFNLSNSGNDSAYRLTVVPRIPTAQTGYASYNLTELAPGSAAQFNMTLVNATGRGTYAGQVDVAYQQGTDFFTAVFPCTFSFRAAPASSVYMTPSLSHESNGTVLVRVAVFNGGASQVEANVSLILPPSLSAAPGNVSLVLPPEAQRNVSFQVSTPSAQASYSAAAAAGYESGGLAHASLATFVISPSVSQPVNPGTVSLGIAAVAVMALLVLLVRSSMKKRRNKPAATQP
jgi:hypothetical protein